MFRRIAPLVSCLLAALTIWAHAQSPPPLAEDPDFQNGLDALRDELPGVAIPRLLKALENRKEDDAARTTIRVHLLEAYVRSGQIESALKLIELPALADHPTAIFWGACLQVSLGHYFEAAETFGRLAGTADPDLRHTAALNRARLLAGLGDRKEALLLLKSIEEVDNPASRDEAALLRSSVLLDAGALDEATALLEPLAPESPRLAKQEAYLLARLARMRNDHEEAAQRFLALVEDREHLPQVLVFGAILGHADSLSALGLKDKAVEFLLDPIPRKGEDTPGLPLEQICNSPRQLEQIFSRLVDFSVESETLDALLRARLVAWAKPSTTARESVLRGSSESVAATLSWQWETTNQTSEIGIHALYYHAQILTKENDSGAVAKAKRLLNRLRLEDPTHIDRERFEDPVHPLTLASLLESALLRLGDKQRTGKEWIDNQRVAALGCLETLEAFADPGNLKGEAAELAARIRFANGDYEDAEADFARARASLTSDAKRFTAINQGLAQLMSGNQEGFSTLIASLDDAEASQALELERAILLASKRDVAAKELLNEFLRTNPNHIRSAEARLALAEISVFTEPRDLAMALAQLDSVDPATFSNRAALRYLLTRLKLGELTGKWDSAIAAATDYLRSRDTPEKSAALLKPAVLLKLGEAFFSNGNYNDARIQFTNVLKLENATRHHEVARFYAAKAALRVGTAEARQSALEDLQQVAADNGPLAVEARLQLARAHLDNADSEPALRELDPILSEDADHASRIDALLLAAEAHLAMGDDSHIEKCLGIYAELLARKDLPYALSNRVHFLKGLALEKLGAAGRALDSYYVVINGENRPKGAPITEWKWFYDCGFRALTLLEEDKSWPAALSVARKLADTKGHRSGDAGLRAEDIQLRHMIWEDK